MTENKTSSYAKLRSRAIRWLLRSPVVALAMHWTFQGMLYMDPTERLFKLALDAAVTALGVILLRSWLSWPLALLAAFSLAHTLNFLFNGHLWGVLKHYGLVEHEYLGFDDYVQAFSRRAEREPGIDYAVVCGSLARHEWTPQSDLDVRLVRAPGILNGLRACWFLLHERTRALFAGFPLDAYILDGIASLQNLRPEERPEMGTEEGDR